jgi:luciferase family oxidoreductase group 1
VLLSAFLDDDVPADHPYAAVKAQPAGPGSPQIWLLGSSDYSGALAAHLGLRFAFAHFISAAGGEQVSREYRRDFRPSALEAAPVSMVAVFAICAQTEAEAERLAASIDLRRVRMEQGVDAPQPDHEEALAYRYSPREEMRRIANRSRLVIGTPDRVRDRLLELQMQFEADEIMLISITGDYESRIRSYELIAAAFGLERDA